MSFCFISKPHIHNLLHLIVSFPRNLDMKRRFTSCAGEQAQSVPHIHTCIVLAVKIKHPPQTTIIAHSTHLHPIWSVVVKIYSWHSFPKLHCIQAMLQFYELHPFWVLHGDIHPETIMSS